MNRSRVKMLKAAVVKGEIKQVHNIKKGCDDRSVF